MVNITFKKDVKQNYYKWLNGFMVKCLYIYMVGWLVKFTYVNFLHNLKTF
jgi:hypothetical protein